MIPMRTVWDDEANSSELLWRYFKTSRFVSFLESSSLHFASAEQFEDRFEGAAAVIPPRLIDPRYAEPDFDEKAFRELKWMVKINCWHRAEYESDAMWRLYAEESKGVVICSTLERMRAAIAPFHLKPTYGAEDLWAGPVRYVDLTQIRIREHGIKRFFYKHRAFERERESRLAINLEQAHEFTGQGEVPTKGVYASAHIEALVERVILGPSLPDIERDQIKKHVHDAGLGNRMVDSILLGQPRYI